MQRDRHYQGIRGKIMPVSSRTDNSSRSSEGWGEPPIPLLFFFSLPATVPSGHRGKNKDMVENSVQPSRYSDYRRDQIPAVVLKALK